MDSFLSAWQSIPKPAFGSASNEPQSAEASKPNTSEPGSFVNLAFGSALKLLGNTSTETPNSHGNSKNKTTSTSSKTTHHNNSQSYYKSREHSTVGTNVQRNSTTIKQQQNGHKIENDKKQMEEIRRKYERSGFVKVDGIDIPFPSYTDYQMWDMQPFNPLFIRDRLRRRITRFADKYEEFGIKAESIPLKDEIASIQDILLAGGDVNTLRIVSNQQKQHQQRQAQRNRNKQIINNKTTAKTTTKNNKDKTIQNKNGGISLITSYNPFDSKPSTKEISKMTDNELTDIMSKYNDLRRTTLISQPCILCGIYDIFFKQLCLSIIRRLDNDVIEQILVHYLDKSLIYCAKDLIHKIEIQQSENDDSDSGNNNNNNNNNENFNPEAILDNIWIAVSGKKYASLELLNYEAIVTLLYAMSNDCNICIECKKQHKIYLVEEEKKDNNNNNNGSKNKKNKDKNKHNEFDTIPNEKDWLLKLIQTLSKYGLSFEKCIKNVSFKTDTALMNPFNCEYLSLYQILMIFITFHPFSFRFNMRAERDYFQVWKICLNHMISEYDDLDDQIEQRHNKIDILKQNSFNLNPVASAIKGIPYSAQTQQYQLKYQAMLENEIKEIEFEKVRLLEEIKLTVFESIVRCNIGRNMIISLVNHLLSLKVKTNISYTKNNAKTTTTSDLEMALFDELDFLVMLLISGHYSGYLHLYSKANLKDGEKLNHNFNRFRIVKTSLLKYGKSFDYFENFDVVLGVSKMIRTCRDIGRIIGIRSCLFNIYKFSNEYNCNIDTIAMENMKEEFIQCLKILYYDYGLYKQYTTNNNDKNKNKNKNTNINTRKNSRRNSTISNKSYTGESKENDTKEEEEEEHGASSYCDSIIIGLRTQRKFHMDCAYLENDILQCLLELKLIDKEYLLDRFKNTWDFMQEEMNVNVVKQWKNINDIIVNVENTKKLREMHPIRFYTLFRNVQLKIINDEMIKWKRNCSKNKQKITAEDIIIKQTQLDQQYAFLKKVVSVIQQFL